MLNRDDIAALLDELAGELEAEGVHGDLFLVGGAAMALAYSTRRATRDLDAIFEPKQVVYRAASGLETAVDCPQTGSTTGSRASSQDRTLVRRSCSTGRGSRSGSPRRATCSP
jgi:Nucleotidyltransferase of unknown function (DUF6036)